MRVNLRRNIRDAIFRGLDLGESLLGLRDPLTPPRKLMNVGSNSILRNDFNAIGQTLFRYLVDVGSLRKDDNVLDIGCGVGRMAIQLTRYLTGTYDGFDIVKESIDHCQNVITAKHPRFRFHHAELFNTHYTPGYAVQPHDFRFPYADGSFSFVFLTSVFTHMRHREVENYLDEIERVLVPGGRCFATYFLLNPQTDALIERGASVLTFRHPMAHGRTDRSDDADAACAYDENFLREIYRDAGLEIAEPIHYGSWPGRATEVGYQDIIVSVKPGRPAAAPGSSEAWRGGSKPFVAGG